MCALNTTCELIAPQLSSEFVVLGDINWDMLNTPAFLQSKLDALDLTQIIMEPTRYNPKSVNTGTLIDIILINMPSKYTSAVFKLLSSNRISVITASMPACVMGLRSNAP
jgi:hypothetical protein